MVTRLQCLCFGCCCLNLHELARDLLRFVAEMEVISPPELRQAVISAMQAGLARHSSKPEPELR